MDNQNKTIITILVIIGILVVILLLRATVFNSDNIEISSTNIETNDQNQLIDLNYENDDIYENNTEFNNDVYFKPFQTNDEQKVELFGENDKFLLSLAISNIIMLAILVSIIIAQWRIFTDADIPGWHSLIPILNNIQLYRIVGISPWLLLVALIPFIGSLINSIISLIVLYRLAILYNKSGWYVLGLIFLPFIFYPLMVFRRY